jgi:hypothetical protein
VINYLENRLSFLDKLYSPSNKEVYTPLALVNEMLDKLSEEVWDDTTLKWLNPAVKNGVFLGSIILRLIKNYMRNGIFNDEEEAYSHIIQNQIYSYALSRGALRTANKLIYGSAKYDGNIIYSNPLEEQIDMKFDVIIGNPPFQSPSKNKKNNRGATRNLYQKFIEKSCNLVKNDSSVIALVTPPGFLKSTDWKKPNKYFNMINKRGISYIKLEGVKEHFNVTSPFCYFISTKSKNIIIDSKETITIKNDDLFFIPSSLDKQTLSIFNKVAYCSNGINMNFKRLNKKPNNKYVAIKPMNNRLWGVKAQLNLENLALGNDLIWEHNRSENIVKILNSKTFSYLIRRTQYDAIIYFKFFNGFRIPKNLDKQWTDKELYKFYNFTEDEINSIETFGEYYLK